MAQFDVHPNPNRASAEEIPYVVDIQVDFLRDLPTRVLVPLVRDIPGAQPTRHLNPSFEIDGERLVLLTDQLAALPAKVLAPAVASVASRRDEIVAALDFLVTGI